MAEQYINGFNEDLMVSASGTPRWPDGRATFLMPCASEKLRHDTMIHASIDRRGLIE